MRNRICSCHLIEGLLKQCNGQVELVPHKVGSFANFGIILDYRFSGTFWNYHRTNPTVQVPLKPERLAELREKVLACVDDDCSHVGQ